MIVNRILAWVSVLGAIAILVTAWRLIDKNLPKPPTAAARVMPPTQPKLVNQRDTDVPTRLPVDGSARYIGALVLSSQRVKQFRLELKCLAWWPRSK